VCLLILTYSALPYLTVPYLAVSYRILPGICTVTASPDQNTVVSGHQDGGVRLWDPARTSLCTHTVEKLHNGHVTHLQYSPRNSYEILTLSRDNTLSILDTRNYLCSQVCTARTFQTPHEIPVILHPSMVILTIVDYFLSSLTFWM
jgi:WD40 repeat protein